MTEDFYLGRLEAFQTRRLAGGDPAKVATVAAEAALVAVEGLPDHERPTILMAWSGLLQRQDAPLGVALRAWFESTGLAPNSVVRLEDFAGALLRLRRGAPDVVEAGVDLVCPGCGERLRFARTADAWAHIAPPCVSWVSANAPTSDLDRAFIAEVFRRFHLATSN